MDRQSFLDSLIDYTKSAGRWYFDFLYKYDPKKKQVFAFYEGDEDSSYYRPIIERYINVDCELVEIVAGDKHTVLKIEREFDWEKYNRFQIAFFVDRDFSYWMGTSSEYENNVFVTDGYSVENYITSERGFEIWLKNFEGFARATKMEIENMIRDYNDAISMFRQEMIPVMANAIVAKKKNKNVKLEQFKLSKGKSLKMMINDEHITIRIFLDDSVRKKWGLTSDDEAKIERQIEQIKERKEWYYVRGKWELKCLGEIGEYMRLNAKVFAPSLGCEKTNQTCSVPTSSCFSAIAPLCSIEVPKRVKEFINNTYMMYLEE